MNRIRIPLSLLLIFAVRATCLGGPGPLVINVDDFEDGDAAGWTELHLLADAFGPSSYEVVDGRYRITTAALPALPIIAAEGAGWDASIDETYSNGVLRTTVRFNNGNTNATLAVRGDSRIPVVSYAFFINNVENVIGIADAALGAGSLVFTPLDIVEGVDYVLEATFMDTQLSISVWRADGTGEAATACVSDARYTAGPFAVAVYNEPIAGGGVGGALSADFDDVTFAPGPDTCPATCAADLNGDRTVGFEDLLSLLSAWGPCP